MNMEDVCFDPLKSAETRQGQQTWFSSQLLWGIVSLILLDTNDNSNENSPLKILSLLKPNCTILIHV